jgi:choice-of-anchor A domain-containing protein/prepilin-type N-terminal cleavage/methylation domain-containing protein
MTTSAQIPDRRPDQGFTLVEVLLTVVMMGLVTAVIAAAIIVVFRSQDGVVSSAAESHDTRQIVSYLPLDIESGPRRAEAYRAAIVAGSPSGAERGSGCDEVGNENVLRIDVTDRRLDEVDRRIAYRVVPTATKARIDRYVCVFDEDTSTWTTESTLNVADSLDPDASPIAEAEIVVANPAAAPAEQIVSNVVVRYVQRGGDEAIVAAPREEQPLANDGICDQEPLSAAQNMATFFERDVTLNNTEVKGALYVGGTLTFHDSNVAQAVPPSPTPPVPGDLGLLAGSVNWAGSTGTLDVKPDRGLIVEDNVYYVVPQSGSQSVVESATSAATPEIVLGSGAVITPGDISAPVVAPVDAFTALRACSDRLAGLPDSCNNGTCADHVGVSGSIGDHLRFTLNTAGIANVLNITESTLLQLQSESIDFTTGITPDADHPLIINVASSPGGVVSFEPPDLQGAGASASYVLWNFPNAGTVNLLSGDRLYGTILAPYGHVNSDTDVEGGVIARSFVINDSTLHDVRYFEGTLDW